MRLVVDDGGRSAAGFRGETGDCVTRAIAIATGKPYKEVYYTLWALMRAYAASHRDRTAKRISRGGGRKGTTPRNGVSRKVYEVYLNSIGWEFHPTMTIGSGCTVHLKASELPQGNIIVRVSKHLAAVRDGVLHDTHDCSRDETRCVYGYYTKTPA